MARPAFKRWWTRYVPVQIERSTFVLLATFLIDHFELFGLKQTVNHALGRPAPQPAFKSASSTGGGGIR